MTIAEEIEGLKDKLKQTQHELEEANVLLELLKKYGTLNDANTKEYVERLYLLAEKLDSTRLSAWAHFHDANIKRLTSDYAQSLELLQQAFNLFEQVFEREGMAHSYNNIGLVHYYRGHYPEALKNHLQSLAIKEETGDKQGIAHSYNNIGIIHEELADYPEALKNHQRALQIREEEGDKLGMASSYNNIANIHDVLGNYPEATKNHLQALRIFEEMGDKRGLAHSYNNLGMIYHHQAKYPEALKNYAKSLQIKEETGYRTGMAVSYNNMGNVYAQMGNTDEALKNHKAALKIRQETDNKSGIASSLNNIGNIQSGLGNYQEAMENFLSALEIAQKTGSKYEIAAFYCNLGGVFEKLGDYNEAVKNHLLAIQIASEIGNKEIIKDSSLSLCSTYKAMGDYANALKYHEQFYEIGSDILGEQAQRQLNNLSFQHNMQQKEKELEIEQLRNVDLKRERDNSEALLLNILPAEVAAELKAKGKPDAKLFEDVSVLYTDFIDFTRYSDKVSPQDLVAELDACFNAFDEITSKYNIEKIKTVGDAYIAVSGLPLANPNHAVDVVKAAVEIRDFMLSRKKEIGDKTFELRIGIHSGNVVAGIVGVKKFAYDIWGDTVNTAARMEQNSEAGKINISQTTYELVKNQYPCEYRGEIQAKNKGKMKMYFVN